jgi:hypothetical protein
MKALIGDSQLSEWHRAASVGVHPSYRVLSTSYGIGISGSLRCALHSSMTDA